MEAGEAPEEAPASDVATKKRSRSERDAAASNTPSGLDAWAEEAPTATANGGARGGLTSSGGGAEGANDGGDAGASHVKFDDTNRGANGRQCFRYGNYHRYYGYRVGESLEDHRIAHLKREWFHGKRCVDIGCNEGLVSLSIAVQFGSTTMLGIDIDTWLVKKAKEKLKRMRRAAAKQAARLVREEEEAAAEAAASREKEKDAVAGGTLRSHPATRIEAAAEDDTPTEEKKPNVKTQLADSGPSLGGVTFRAGNFLDEVFPPGSVDAFLCLSVTKWIQLNWGDSGLKKMFRTIHDALSPGGVFIVEPQPWKSYKQAFRKQKMPEETRAHMKGIELRPAFYAEHLRKEVGFSSVEAIRSADLHVADEFDRNLLLCIK